MSDHLFPVIPPTLTPPTVVLTVPRGSGVAGGGSASVEEADNDPANEAIKQAMVELYNHYFACHDYEKRYPKPNVATLRFLLDQGAGEAREILDFGCGNGRYALALLQASQARVTGYDISEAALTEFDNHLGQSPGFRGRAQLLHGPASVLRGHGPYDMILVLFGVLSHVGDRTARLAALRQMHAVIAPGGKLVLTVPSLLRRRPRELIRAALDRRLGRAQGAQKEAGNILFTRQLGGKPHQFFYHLYSVGRLREELREAGFALQTVGAESLLPEWMITQHPWLGWLDAKLSRCVPAVLGYGIRAVAVPL